MALTDTTLRSLKPGPKPRKVSDGKGLYIEVAPTGGKWWRLKYRIGGKEKRLSLGVYPDVSLRDARDRRDDARKLLARRIDPSEQRKADKGRRRTDQRMISNRLHANGFQNTPKIGLRIIAIGSCAGSNVTYFLTSVNGQFPKLQFLSF
jgi:hypothetical protein